MINPQDDKDDLGRKVICNDIKEINGKEEKVQIGKGIIKSIEARVMYDDEEEKKNPGKIAVVIDGEKKSKKFTKDQLDWEPIDLILKEHIDTEQNFFCSVAKISKPYIKIIKAKFECPSCGTIISVPQLDEKFRQPSRCSCGRRGGFRLIEKFIIEAQDITVNQKDTDFEFKAYIEGKKIIDLLKDIQDKNFLSITGVIEYEWHKKTSRGDYIIKINNIEEKKEKRPAFLK